MTGWMVDINTVLRESQHVGESDSGPNSLLNNESVCQRNVSDGNVLDNADNHSEETSLRYDGYGEFLKTLENDKSPPLLLFGNRQQEQHHSHQNEDQDTENDTSLVEREKVREQADNDNIDEDEPLKWEDFMLQYWQIVKKNDAGNGAQSTLEVAQLEINDDVDRITQEDTDMKPCPIEPELDEEHALHLEHQLANDMRENSSYSQFLGNSTTVGFLSKFGIDSSRLMASDSQIDPSCVDDDDDPDEADPSLPGRMENLKLSGGHIQHTTTHQHKVAPQCSSTASDQGVLRSVSPFSSKLSFETRSESSSVEGYLKTTSSTHEGSVVSSSGTLGTAAVTQGGAPTWPHEVSPLPDASLVLATGPIFTRTSLRSLLMKKWHTSEWMRFGPHCLYVFRSRDHLEDWLHNPYHAKKQREYLIKLKIDFLGEMMKEGSLGHRALPIKAKSYGRNEPVMYQFKLEQWTNLGVAVIAAFASYEEKEVKILHDIIGECLKGCPHGGLRSIDHMLKK